MATSYRFNRVNINGIPCMEATGSTVNGNNVTYNFNPTLGGARFSGLIAIKIKSAPTVSAAGVVSFDIPDIANTEIALTKVGGTQASTDDVTAGIYLVFYDRPNNVLQLV